MICIIALLLVIALAMLRIKRKNGLLKNNEKNLKAQAEELSATNSKQKEANDELAKSNDKFEQTNAKREYMAKSYISLCYLYIEKLESQRKMVIRKIKANQQKEPLLVEAHRRGEPDLLLAVRQHLPLALSHVRRGAEHAAHARGAGRAEGEQRADAQPACGSPYKARHYREFDDSRHTVLFAPDHIQLSFGAEERRHRQG